MPLFVSTSAGPPEEPWASLNDYDGSGNVIYVGQAKSFQPKTFTFTVTSVSKANPAVVTITGHGLQTDNVVTISGGTGDWAGINGDQIVTVTGANTFTIPVNTSAYAGTFAGTITSNAPRTNASVWAVQKLYYDGSNRNTRSAWAKGTSAANVAWDSRTTYHYE